MLLFKFEREVIKKSQLISVKKSNRNIPVPIKNTSILLTNFSLSFSSEVT